MGLGLKSRLGPIRSTSSYTFATVACPGLLTYVTVNVRANGCGILRRSLAAPRVSYFTFVSFHSFCLRLYHSNFSYDSDSLSWVVQRARRSAAWHAESHQALVAGHEARVHTLEHQVQALLQEMKAYRIGFASPQDPLQDDSHHAASPWLAGGPAGFEIQEISV